MLCRYTLLSTIGLVHVLRLVAQDDISALTSGDLTAACSRNCYYTARQLTGYIAFDFIRMILNPFKPSGAKWLHFKLFRAVLD